ncbi:MAG: rhodanese-like domain-containing protein [Bacteroidales bacterium]
MENNKGFWILAPIVLVLAIILSMLGKPSVQRDADPKDILLLAVKGSQYYSTDQVADLLINHDPGLVLVDVRTPAEYEKWHIEEAVNIPVDSLLNPAWMSYLKRQGQTVVFCSNDDALAQMAWLATRRLGVTNTFVMKGGLNEWFNTIVNPPVPMAQNDKVQLALYAKRMGARQHFYGLGLPGSVTQEEKPKEAPKKVVKPAAVHHGAAEGGC